MTTEAIRLAAFEWNYLDALVIIRWSMNQVLDQPTNQPWPIMNQPASLNMKLIYEPTRHSHVPFHSQNFRSQNLWFNLPEISVEVHHRPWIRQCDPYMFNVFHIFNWGYPRYRPSVSTHKAWKCFASFDADKGLEIRSAAIPPLS